MALFRTVASVFDWLAQSKLLVALLFFPFILVATYSYTTIRFYIQSRASRWNCGKEPPTLPYALPWVGSALVYCLQTHVLLRRIG